jgi:hypothetical protein
LKSRSLIEWTGDLLVPFRKAISPGQGAVIKIPTEYTDSNDIPIIKIIQRQVIYDQQKNGNMYFSSEYLQQNFDL